MKLEDMTIEYKSLHLEVPGFVLPDITVREIALNAELDIVEYMDRLDPLWIAAIYPTFHEEIYDSLWDGHSLEMLVAKEFNQHCFNFVISATIGWCKETVHSLSQLLNSGNLVLQKHEGNVLPFVRH